LLLNAGADINHQDMHFNSPLHYASIFDKVEIVKTLLSRKSIKVNLENCDRKTPF
jgi:ankyrin repeat protein